MGQRVACALIEQILGAVLSLCRLTLAALGSFTLELEGLAIGVVFSGACVSIHIGSEELRIFDHDLEVHERLRTEGFVFPPVIVSFHSSPESTSRSRTISPGVPGTGKYRRVHGPEGQLLLSPLVQSLLLLPHAAEEEATSVTAGGNERRVKERRTLGRIALALCCWSDEMVWLRT